MPYIDWGYDIVYTANTQIVCIHEWVIRSIPIREIFCSKCGKIKALPKELKTEGFSINSFVNMQVYKL